MTTSTKEEFTDTEEDTSRMEMAAAFAELEKKEPEVKEEKPEVKAEVKEEKPEVKEEKPEVKVETKVEPEVKAETKVEPENQLLTQDKAPVGWSPKMRERWGTLDPEVRAEVLRREEASALGVRQLQEQFAPANQFVQSLMPFIEEAANNNVNPAQHINNVMQAERRLRTGSDQDKFGALVEIAEGYGIPLRTILNEALGKDVIPPPQRPQALPPEVQRELTEYRQMKAQQTQQPQSTEDSPEIKAFASSHEYFEDVREIMADLYQAGFSKDLQALYDEAVWRNPGVREVVLEKQRGAGALTEKQKAAAGLKVKSSNVSEMKSDAEHDDEDSLEDTVRKAVMAGTGRV